MRMTLGPLQAVGKISQPARKLEFEFELFVIFYHHQFIFTVPLQTQNKGLSSKFEYECIQIELMNLCS